MLKEFLGTNLGSEYNNGPESEAMTYRPLNGIDSSYYHSVRFKRIRGCKRRLSIQHFIN